MIAVIKLKERIVTSPGTILARRINPLQPGPAIKIRRKPWVARILGLCDTFGLEREFAHYYRDYATAYRSGDCATLCFILPEGHFYEVCEIASTKRDYRHFVRSTRGNVVDVEKSEVIEWASQLQRY